MPIKWKVFASIVLLIAIAGPVFADSGIEIGYSQVLPVHIALMSLAFVSMTSGATIARYLKKNKKWLKLHKTFQWTSAVAGILGVAAGIVLVEVSSGIHLRVAHTIIALASVVLIILAIVVAYGFLKRKKHKKELRILHRWIGRLTITGFLVTIVFGLFQAGIF